MVWLRVDDGFAEHRKLDPLLAHPARWARAVAVWLAAGCYCARAGTDGVVTAERLRRCTPLEPGELAEATADLVAIGLWSRVTVTRDVTRDTSQTGARDDARSEAFAFHDWADYQPSNASVTAQRDAARERQQRSRNGKNQRKTAEKRTPPVTRDVSQAVTRDRSQAVTRDNSVASHSPVPSRPVPIQRRDPESDAREPDPLATRAPYVDRGRLGYDRPDQPSVPYPPELRAQLARTLRSLPDPYRDRWATEPEESLEGVKS